MTHSTRERLLREEIAREQQRLERLDEERRRTRAKLQSLRAAHGRLNGEGARDEAASNETTGSPSLTSKEKLELFRRRFRGREDVFAKRWTNPRTGRSGYAPACRNEWVKGVCEKPRIKCGECPRQAFVPVTDQVLLDHLRGRHVVGVYPLLQDETCWFLAADFDGESWREDVHVFAEVCRNFDLSPAIERSRSGRGAHIWFFFLEAVPAAAARNLGSFLITEAMSRRHQLAMSSYDRLFPSQDTMPKGGFGNLIALPFQDAARRAGNTVFLDRDLEPYPDQWAFLAATPLLTLAKVETIVSEALRRDGILGLRTADDDEEKAPWTRRPSGRSSAIRIAGPLPDRVEAVLSQRLFVEKRGLPSALINQIKRLAAFPNPEFYKKQSLRLSTALTPRVISCAEELPRHVALPRGCRSDVQDLLSEHGVELAVRDERIEDQSLELDFEGQLSSMQSEAAEALLAKEIGILVAPPGTGKTVVGVYLVAKRQQSTLILVHRQPLAEQWRAQLALFLGIEEKEIGQLGGGRKKTNGRLDVAMLQSLVRKDSVRDLVADYGQVIVDECHHVPAVSFERVLAEVRAKYVFGLTATPTRRDGCHPILHMQCGPIRYAVDPQVQAERRPLEHRLVVRETRFRIDGVAAAPGIQTIYGEMALDDGRNGLIVEDILSALEAGRSPLVLTERRDHLATLESLLRQRVRNVVVLRGGMRTKERREAVGKLEEPGERDERVVLATGRYVGEGFDDARLDTLFLTMPVSWKGTLIQYVGRLHRNYAGKSEVQVYDYVDREVPMLAGMWRKRLRTYRAMGYDMEREAVGPITVAGIATTRTAGNLKAR